MIMGGRGRGGKVPMIMGAGRVAASVTTVSFG
jgi:hypothetical protein